MGRIFILSRCRPTSRRFWWAPLLDSTDRFRRPRTHISTPNQKRYISFFTLPCHSSNETLTSWLDIQYNSTPLRSIFNKTNTSKQHVATCFLSLTYRLFLADLQAPLDSSGVVGHSHLYRFRKETSSILICTWFISNCHIYFHWHLFLSMLWIWTFVKDTLMTNSSNDKLISKFRTLYLEELIQYSHELQKIIGNKKTV